MYTHIKPYKIHRIGKEGIPIRYLASHEQAERGRFDFPIQLYCVHPSHPRYEMPFHWHMEYELILVLQGQFHLFVDGEGTTLHAGDSALIPEGAIHGGSPDRCIYECVVFDLERFLPAASVCNQALQALVEGGGRLQAVFRNGTSLASLISSLFQAMETETDGYEFTTTGLLMVMLGELQTQKLYQKSERGNGRGDARTVQIKKALQLIRTAYARQLSLAELAAEAAMQPKYFCRIFRQITGRSPVEYLNYYRVECAAELLCISTQNITDIALACGFNDVGYFSRIFRRYKGTTPGQFRRTHRV